MKNKLLIICLSIFVLLTGQVYAQSSDESEVDLNVENINTEKQEDTGIVFRHAERREANPFQIQLVQTFGPATPYSFAPGAGLHLGYQISRTVYLGLTSSAFFDGKNSWDGMNDYRYDDDEAYEHDRKRVYGQEGADKTESELDPVHLLELRLTPWDFGLYFSVGALYRGEQKSTTQFKSEKRDVGENTYTTGLEATVSYEEWYGVATGIGFNYIFDCGLSMGTGFNVALGRQTPDVTVSATTAVSEEDLAYWKKQIKANEEQVPYLFTLSLGYAF